MNRWVGLQVKEFVSCGFHKTLGDAESSIDFIWNSVAVLHPEINGQVVPIVKSPYKQVLVF